MRLGEIEPDVFRVELLHPRRGLGPRVHHHRRCGVTCTTAAGMSVVTLEEFLEVRRRGAHAAPE